MSVSRRVFIKSSVAVVLAPGVAFCGRKLSDVWHPKDGEYVMFINVEDDRRNWFVHYNGRWLKTDVEHCHVEFPYYGGDNFGVIGINKSDGKPSFIGGRRAFEVLSPAEGGNFYAALL